MKRSEPLWKREAARKHCKEQYNAVWKTLSKPSNSNKIQSGINYFDLSVISIVKYPVNLDTIITKVKNR